MTVTNRRTLRAPRVPRPARRLLHKLRRGEERELTILQRLEELHEQIGALDGSPASRSSRRSLLETEEIFRRELAGVRGWTSELLRQLGSSECSVGQR